MTLNLSGDLPLSLKEGLHVVRDSKGVTKEKFSASIDFGTWWRVGADITLRGLISEIENGDDFLTFVEKAEPTIRAGIYTVPLDVTASVKITENTTISKAHCPHLVTKTTFRNRGHVRQALIVLVIIYVCRLRGSTIRAFSKAVLFLRAIFQLGRL